MKRLVQLVLAVVMLALASAAQQPQTPDVTNIPPLFAANAKYVNGVAPGYWPTWSGSGLTLNISAGTVWCQGTIRTYAGGTLTMTNSTTNYVYLDPTASCAPAASTSAFTTLQVPIAQVVAAGGVITAVTDVRGAIASYLISSGTVTSVTINGTTNEINVTGTCTITTSGTCTVSLPAAIVLGTDNSVAGTVQTANGAAAAHTTWGSAATTSNIILGFATVPGNGHMVTCTVSGSTCTLTDGGAPATGTVTSVTCGTGLTGGTITTTGTCALDTSHNTGRCVFSNDTQSATALVAAQFSGLVCPVPGAATIVEIDVTGGTGVLTGSAAAPTVTGTSSVQVGKRTPNGGASTTSLMSAALATASGQACALPTAGSATCPIMGITQAGSSLSITTTSLSKGDELFISAATPDATQTWYTVIVWYTLN